MERERRKTPGLFGEPKREEKADSSGVGWEWRRRACSYPAICHGARRRIATAAVRWRLSFRRDRWRTDVPELCAFLPCSRSGNSKPVANASRPLTPLSMNFRESFSAEEPATAPVSHAAPARTRFHPTCKSNLRLPALDTSAPSNFTRNPLHAARSFHPRQSCMRRKNTRECRRRKLTVRDPVSSIATRDRRLSRTSLSFP